MPILRTLFGVSVLDVVLGAVLASYALFVEGTPRIWRGAFVLLVVGALGLMWFGAALRRRRAEVRA
ncbi:MAG: hypothetical protein ACKVWV_13545 [Planctomycetota bacterium]